jgi:hypothetical protein
MLPRRIGLASRTQRVSFVALSKVAAALNVQVTRDLQPIWGVTASVIALSDPDSIEPGVWPIYIEDDIPENALGLHLTNHQQPFAKVRMGDTWPLTVSHECLEMLIDPSGNRLVSSSGIAIDAQGQIIDLPDAKYEYLVEVCDPSEHPDNAYTIDDVLVSDFYTPNFFDPLRASGVRYSFTGKLTKPRHILPGGYISWFNPALRRLQQLQYFDTPRIFDIPGSLADTDRNTLRGFIDAQTSPPVALSDVPNNNPAVEKSVARGMWLANAASIRAQEFDTSPTLHVTAAAGDIASTAAAPADATSFAGRAVQHAIEQWDLFGRQTYDLQGHRTHTGHQEGEDPWYKRIGDYWKNGVNDSTLDGRDDVPWSAAFISWVMHSAGAGNRFNYSPQHSVYISRAIRDLKRNEESAGYWCYRLHAMRPSPGDIVCWGRQAGIDYDNQHGGDYKGHCDIIVSVGNGAIEIIGGNVGNSVTRRPLALDADGFIKPLNQHGENLFGLMKCRL